MIATRSDPARGPRLAGRAPLGRPAAARPSATRLASTRASVRVERIEPRLNPVETQLRLAAGGRTRRAAPPRVRRVLLREGEPDLGLVLAERGSRPWSLAAPGMHPYRKEEVSARAGPRCRPAPKAGHAPPDRRSRSPRRRQHDDDFRVGPQRIGRRTSAAQTGVVRSLSSPAWISNRPHPVGDHAALIHGDVVEAFTAHRLTG